MVNNLATTTLTFIYSERGRTPKTLYTVRLIKCENDRDSDGFLNEVDNCPDSYGSRNNFGCSGESNLLIDASDSVISAPTWGSYSLNYANRSGNNNAPIFSRFSDGFLSFKPLKIENKGNGIAKGGIRIKFYLSKNNTVDSDDYKFPDSFNIDRSFHIEPGKSGNFERKLFGASVGNKLSYGWYRFIIHVEHYSYIGNYPTKTFTYNFPIEYINSHIGWSLKQFTNQDNKIKSTNSFNNIQREFRVYTLLGEQILSDTISTTKEENELLGRLPMGVYIIRSGNSVRKIYKN